MWGAGTGADGASTLVSFLNLLTNMLHGLQAFSGPIGLSKVLEGSSYPRSFLDPAMDGVTSGPQPVSGLGKAFPSPAPGFSSVSSQTFA